LSEATTVGRADRLSVVEFEALAQSECVTELVVANLPCFDHLWSWPELAVHREQRVVDHVTKIARDVDAAPIRVEAGEIGLRDEAQRRVGALLRRDRHREKQCEAADEEKPQ